MDQRTSNLTDVELSWETSDYPTVAAASVGGALRPQRLNEKGGHRSSDRTLKTESESCRAQTKFSA